MLRVFLPSFSFCLRVISSFTSVVRDECQPHLQRTKYLSGIGLRGTCTKSVRQGVVTEKFDLLYLIVS